MKKIMMLTVAAIFSLGTAASAATISYSATPNVATANPIGTLIAGDFDQNVTDPGLVPGRRSPWQGTTLDGSVYSSITGAASYTFGSLRTKLSLVWGSPDAYNTLSFLLDGVEVGSVNGIELVGCCGTNIPSSLITISGVGQFDEVVFTSGAPAFEYANVAAVPLPAGGLLLLGALGGIAALRRRKTA